MIRVCILLVIVYSMGFLNLIFPFAYADSEIDCYEYTSTIDIDKDYTSLIIESPKGNVVALQGTNELAVQDITADMLYLPFSTNIVQSPSNNGYNVYTFESLDTDSNRTIIITPQLDTNAYILNFSTNSRYYNPQYFISEDGKNYSQVSKNDIDKFNPQKIKIELIPKNTNQNIREKINITELSIARKNPLYYIDTFDGLEPITLYIHNTCFNQNTNNKNIPKIAISQYQASKKILVSNPGVNPTYILKKQDSDSDGIPNLTDNCRYVRNVDQQDVNQNGIGDICEFDNDKDGINNGADNCINVANANQLDTDKDGIGNTCDNCEIYNPDQLDIDNNGIGDTCDRYENLFQTSDADGDRVLDSQDNCRNIANPDQADSDNDGVGNVCDNCKTYQNSTQEDRNENGIGDICEDVDNDGIDSLMDNCPYISNPDQVDSDNDGVGNVCEDDDYDSIVADSDNCPFVYNPDQKDTDKDRIGDACDKTDDRFIESNKTFFIALLLGIFMVFSAIIFFLYSKVHTNQK